MVKNGYLNKRCKKKLYLSSVHKYKRFQFTIENVNKDMNWYRNIFWTDEFTVKQFPNRKFETYWSRQSDTLHNEVVSRQKQQGGFSVCFWGGFSFWGRSRLTAFGGTVDAVEYCNLLKSDVVPIFNASPDELTFMHDNAPIHTSFLVEEFLQEKGLEVLQWPVYSPDLNPIENLWAIVKRKLYEKFSCFGSRDDLVDAVFQIWNEIEEYIFQQLSEGVCERLEEVIRRKGKFINK
eukprot:NODE_887_length_3307_cov_0.181733.p1 type:complete len:235 gc:universal NODE_887_length_3307_cov_0.181733:2405-3109(+)